MAWDEAYAQSVAQSKTPTLRLYQWSAPTLSLGYFQRYDDRRQHPPSGDCAVVRRTSGGGALMHDREWTYSLAVPRTEGLDSDKLYQLVHESLCEHLQQFGVDVRPWGRATDERREGEFLCFHRRTEHDLVVQGHKVVGSAQRKRRQVLMQHGAVLLQRSPHAPELPGVCDLAELPAGDCATLESSFSNDWINALSEKLRWSFAHSMPTEAEKDLAKDLANSRFLCEDWNFRRR